MGRVPYSLKNNNYLALNYKLVRIAKTQTGKWLFSSTTLNGSSKKSRRSDFSYTGRISVHGKFY